MYKNYNPKDKDSIFDYAKKLKNKTFKEIYTDNLLRKQYEIEEDHVNYQSEVEDNVKHKGGLGELIEEHYFHYEVDNMAKADFPQAKVELKVTPYRKNKNGSLSAKERLIISMINYFDIIDADFYTSNVWEKIENILLIYYYWDPKIKNRLDYTIQYIYMYSPSKKDLEIIKTDYYKIKSKVSQGLAHELSEGDTLYLGAATKASNAQDRRKQPFSNEPAKPRAFSLKSSYMTTLLRSRIQPSSQVDDEIIKDSVVSDFESFILSKLNKHINRKDTDLFKQFFNNEEQIDKSKYSRLAFEILGVKTRNALEFEKANIEVKSIRLEENNKIRESMSFPHFIIMDLLEEEWETSYIKDKFEKTKFLFIVYKKTGDNYYLNGAKFWNMPTKHINSTLKKEWELIHQTFRNGVNLEVVQQKNRTIVKNNLPSLSDTKILHVRPHARLSAYEIDGEKYGSGKLSSNADILPNGDFMTKQCFWLNKYYIEEQIKDLVI